MAAAWAERWARSRIVVRSAGGVRNSRACGPLCFLGNVPFVNALFLGIKAAVLVIVIEALLRISKRALQSSEHWIIAGLAFVGLFLLNLPFPLIVVAAALFGFLRERPPARQ